jgi:glycosyltransferase involved in cell wall biosynthesis
MRKRIKIGIDIRDLKIARTGTQTYLKELCREFKALQDENYQFYFFDTSLPIYKGEYKVFKIIEHVRYQIWKQIALPLKAWIKGCDILFCTDNYVPLIKLGFKTVPVFHDAFFFENPEHFNKHWLWLYRKLAVPAARNSPIVVTPTHYAKKQIQYYTKIDPDKLVVIYEGPKSLKADKGQGRKLGQKILSNFDFISGEYILHVGVMNKRKNIPALIRAFKILKEKEASSLKLVLAGQMDNKRHSSDAEEIWKAINEGDFKEDIILTGYLLDEELEKVYAGALMYVFPSLNEGFGIPILEAWSYYLPVLVADNTCLPEVGGKAVLTFDPSNSNDMAEKMELIWRDEKTRSDLIEKGRLRLKGFTWKKTAESILNEFISIVEKDKDQ